MKHPYVGIVQIRFRVLFSAMTLVKAPRAGNKDNQILSLANNWPYKNCNCFSHYMKQTKLKEKILQKNNL
jgi:hypothetical protein